MWLLYSWNHQESLATSVLEGRTATFTIMKLGNSAASHEDTVFSIQCFRIFPTVCQRLVQLRTPPQTPVAPQKTHSGRCVGRKREWARPRCNMLESITNFFTAYKRAPSPSHAEGRYTCKREPLQRLTYSVQAGAAGRSRRSVAVRGPELYPGSRLAS